MSEKWARAVGLFEVISGGTVLLNYVLGALIWTITITSVPLFVTNSLIQTASILGGLYLLFGVPSGVPISFLVQLSQIPGVKTATTEIAFPGALAFHVSWGVAPGVVTDRAPASFAISFNVLAIIMAVFLLWYWDHRPKKKAAEHAAEADGVPSGQ